MSVNCKRVLHKRLIAPTGSVSSTIYNYTLSYPILSNPMLFHPIPIPSNPTHLPAKPQYVLYGITVISYIIPTGCAGIVYSHT